MVQPNILRYNHIYYGTTIYTKAQPYILRHNHIYYGTTIHATSSSNKVPNSQQFGSITDDSVLWGILDIFYSNDKTGSHDNHDIHHGNTGCEQSRTWIYTATDSNLLEDVIPFMFQ